MSITAKELAEHLSKNNVKSGEVFDIIDSLSLDNIPSLCWRYEEKYKSLKVLVDLVNTLKLTLPKGY